MTGDIPARERVLVGIAVLAFVVSSVALFEYASSIPGYSGVSALALPFLLEGLTLALGSIAVARHDRGDRAGLAGAGFGGGVTLATVINYAHAIPNIVPADLAHAAQALPWILPPLSMTVAYKVVVQERRVRRQTAEAQAARQARRQTTRHDT
ncbi:MAG: DUF2637 domain-containing protein, partial [Luteitalea sp.]|nr:DUF2637 domain-containing protein [Luteitalea sp.]